MTPEQKAPRVKGRIEHDKEADAFVDKLKKDGYLGDIDKKINFVKTGSWVIDRLIGDGTHQDKPGGIPRGYITEIYGNEATGKTTIGLSIAKQALLAGQRVIYADFEQSLRTQFQYIKNMGIDTSPPNFLHIVPTNIEEGAKVIGQSLVKLRPSVIIIDSVTAMIPKDNVEREAEDGTQIGLHSKLVGNFILWFMKRLPKYDCAMVLINQLRANIKKDQYEEGPKEVTSGGKAVRYFTTLRIKLKASSEQADKEFVSFKNKVTGIDEKKIVSQVVKVVVEKNKLDMPFKSGPIYIEFGQGIDNIQSLIKLGLNKKVIKMAGAQLSWQDPNSDKSFSVQGKQALKKHLEMNPDTLEALKPYLLPSTDMKEVDELYNMLEAKGVAKLTPDEKEQLREARKVKGLPTDDLDFNEEELKDLESLKELTSGLDKK